MRLGTSWRVGHSIPNGVPRPLHAAILACETAEGGSIAAATQAAPAYWKLTWLEGTAYLSCTLRPEQVLTLHNGAPVWRSLDSAWSLQPSGAETPAGGSAHDAAAYSAVIDSADEDDDWLL